MSQKYQNYINGKWQDAKCGQTFENRNPANWDEIIGIFPKSKPEDVNEAVEAARKAYNSWRLVPPPKRGEIMKKVGDLLVARKEEIAKLMTREMGKVIKETRGDVQEGIDTAYYAAGETRRLFGYTTTSELPNKFCMSIRQPIGVCGVITPWNFPMAIPTWKILPALACGNTVVFKTATDNPATAAKLVEILVEAGVPAGVINIVFGGGREVGNVIVEHKDTKLITFTGSSDVGRYIGEVCGKMLKRCSLELGGKNAQIIMDDANIESAIDGVLWGAFGTTGQRCTATSRLIIHEKVYKETLERLVERTNKLKLGNGLDESVDVGPLVNEGQLKTMIEYTEIGKKEGAKLLCGGEPYKQGECAKGWFFRPTIFGDVTPNMRIAQEEIFGPILSVFKAKSLEDAIEILNNTSYGLSSSIYTQDVNNAFKAIRDIEAGITYINSSTIGAECHLPFGGVKDTGNGHREGGWTVYDIFTEWKTVYVDYSGKLQKAQIDTN